MAANQPAGRAGRKGKYEYWRTPDGLILLEGWARDGLTDEQIAHNLGISRSTLAEWKKRFSDISDALKKGKEVVDYEVENALLKRAVGFYFTEKKTEIGPEGEQEKYTTTVKYVPPDTAAAFIWLKNRCPDKWRDKPEAPGDPETLKKARALLEGIKSAID